MSREETDYSPPNIDLASRAILEKIPEEQVKEFGKLPSDLQRYQLAARHPALSDVITLEPSFNAKSSTEAAEHRKKGNEFFKKKSYVPAVENYTKSILAAPQKSAPGVDNQLSLAYANRSAALFHMKKYELALQDIELALESGYPEDMQYKLYDRKAKCCRGLHRITDANKCLNLTLDFITKAKLDEKYTKKWNADIQKELQECSKLKDETFDKVSGPKDVPVLKKPDPVYPKATTSLQVKYSKEQGRYTVAGEDLRIGEAVIKEDPYSAVLFPDYFKSHCYHCFSRVFAPVPCNECSSIVYCGKQCRDASWEKYHHYECSYFAFFDYAWCGRLGHISWRLVLDSGLKDLLGYLRSKPSWSNPKSEATGLNPDGVYGSDYRSVFSMTCNSGSRTSESLVDFAVFSAFLTSLLKVTGFVKEQNLQDGVEYSEADIELVGAALMRHLQIIQCNGKGIIEVQRPSDFENLEPKEIGIGLYCTAALVNHSCNPSCDFYFYGNTLVMRPTRDVYKGHDVSVDYGVTFHNDEKQHRNIILRANFDFFCSCEPCREGWSSWRVLETEQPYFACEECHEYLELGDFEAKKFIRCIKCNFKNDINLNVQNLMNSHEAYSVAMQDAMGGRSEKALSALVSHMTIMQKYLVMPWKDMAACQRAIKNCFMLQANAV